MLEPFFEIRVADVVDILLVTALLYTAIVWIRRTQAAFVAIGVLIIGALYVAATALDLRLTAWIFQGFIAIFLVMIVVIFQEELRQLFERIAVWSLRRGRTAGHAADATDVLVRCLADLAKDRVGALVVLPGTQPLQRHVRGGIELNGTLSEPLLKSIFDPHSPGHDGAVIVEQGRVTRFAAHLPLSVNFQQLSGVGTRHSAALGLAELTDALCLVVSEERGHISVARDGRLFRVGDIHELTAVLQRFVADKYQAGGDRRRPIVRLLRENWIEKAAALMLVIGLWYAFVPGSRPAHSTYDVPVVIANLPSELTLESVDPTTVKATFSGPQRAFYLFDRDKLKVTVDASLAQLGRRTFEISPNNIVYPKDLTLEGVEPSKVKISVGKVSAGKEGNGPAEPLEN